MGLTGYPKTAVTDTTNPRLTASPKIENLILYSYTDENVLMLWRSSSVSP